MVRVKITPDSQAAPIQNQRNNPVKPYQDVAEGMEANFTSHLLQEMRKTVPKDNPDSSAMDYYNSLLDYERAQLMAKSDSGLGVKKVILDQIVPQHLKHYVKNTSAAHPVTRQGMTKETAHE
jgi:Rod binding domain-containing protein